MASNARHISKHQFLCAICLDTFTQPVSTPCGHNFCLSCLSLCWDDETVCRCPICKEAFQERPHLKVNTLISELVSQLMLDQVEDTPSQCKEGAGVAENCDICTDVCQQAVKSCFECQTSFCSQHLEPHRRVAGLKRHTLINPVLHHRKVESFFLDDKEMLCDTCASSGHTNHNVAPLREAHQVMKNLLGSREERMQLMIQDLLTRVQAKEDKITSSEQEFTAMVREFQESWAMLVSLRKERQQAAEKEACPSIGNLRRKLSVIEGTEDLISFLENCQALPCLPHAVELPRQGSAGNMDTRHFQKSPGSYMSKAKTLRRNPTQEARSPLQDDPLNEPRQYEVSITLDPDTAHCRLALSGDGKGVRFTSAPLPQHPFNPWAFTTRLAVLGRQGFSSGKFYFEVFVGKKTEWCLGVARASVQKNSYFLRSAGWGIWALWFIVDRFESWSAPRVTVFNGRVERIGLFVDYDKGEMLFYDVETSRLIYSFMECRFTEEIHPYFSPCNNKHGSNLDPMVIVPVQSQGQ